MKDSLNNFINENRDEFDDNEPSDGHLERMKAKLEANASAEPTAPKVISFEVRKLWYAAAAAAAIALVLVAAWMTNGTSVPVLAEIPNVTETPAAIVSLSDVSPEMAEVEDYFIQSVSTRVQAVDNYGQASESFVQSCLGRLELLESDYAELKKDLSANLNDQRVINAMIQNYRIRLQVLDQLLRQLELNQQRKQGKDGHYQS